MRPVVAHQEPERETIPSRPPKPSGRWPLPISKPKPIGPHAKKPRTVIYKPMLHG